MGSYEGTSGSSPRPASDRATGRPSKHVDDSKGPHPPREVSCWLRLSSTASSDSALSTWTSSRSDLVSGPGLKTLLWIPRGAPAGSVGRFYGRLKSGHDPIPLPAWPLIRGRLASMRIASTNVSSRAIAASPTVGGSYNRHTVQEGPRGVGSRESDSIRTVASLRGVHSASKWGRISSRACGHEPLV
jgi:hypothetical protein